MNDQSPMNNSVPTIAFPARTDVHHHACTVTLTGFDAPQGFSKTGTGPWKKSLTTDQKCPVLC